MSIQAYMDYALVEGIRIDRPSRVSRDEWLNFWEAAQRYGLKRSTFR